MKTLKNTFDRSHLTFSQSLRALAPLISLVFTSLGHAQSPQSPPSAALVSPAISHIVFADLAFDTPTMQADASRAKGCVGYRVSVKNIGTRASTSSEMKCTDIVDIADTAPGPNMGKISRKTQSWTRAIPAVAANGAYADNVEVNGAEDLLKRSCVIDAANVSGDKNRSNNSFEYVSPKFFSERARAPRGNLPVFVK
jgi:hypothetical protein